MAFQKYLIRVSEDWLGELEHAAHQQALLASSEVMNLIAHVRVLKRERDQAIEEMESFARGLPPLKVPSDAERRDAWAKLGWIVS